MCSVRSTDTSGPNTARQRWVGELDEHRQRALDVLGLGQLLQLQA